MAWVVLHSGLLAAYQKRRGGDVILLYHRVVSDASELLDYSPYGISVSRADFAAQMAFLARHYDVVPLSAMATAASGRRPRCAITFDDGWRDNLTAAWPVLQQHGFPVTIFLATNLMDGGDWFWEERVMALAAHCQQIVEARREGAAHLQARVVDPDVRAILELPSTRLPATLSALVGRLRTDELRRSAVIAALDAAATYPGCPPARWFLSWADVLTMAAQGVSFGGHTASHVNLNRCPLRDANDEIERNWEVLAHVLGHADRSFAYPYGKHTQEVRRFVAAAGFSYACTTERRALRKTEDPFRLPRVDVYDAVARSVPMFACRIASFLGLY